MSTPDPPPTDAELARRIRAGDRDAFETVFRAHYATLVPFARRFVQSTEIAEELVQDLFLRLWVRHDELLITESLRTYLFRATRNHALNHLRRRRLERLWQSRQPHEEPVTSDSADETAHDELAARARAAIARLPERCRQVFLLSREQSMTYAEIADVMGISIKTVETQMGRALKALRAALGQEGRGTKE